VIRRPERRAAVSTPLAARLGAATVRSERKARGNRLAEWSLLVVGGLIVSGPPRLRTRDLNTALESPLSLDPAAMVQVVTWLGGTALVGYLLYAHLLRRSDLFLAVRRNPPIAWYLGYGILAFASAGWSPAPPYTLFAASKLLTGLLVFTLIVYYERNATLDRALKLLLWVYAAKLAALALLFVVSPDLVYQEKYQGLELAARRVTGGAVLEDYGTSPLFAGLLMLSVAIFGSNWVRRTLALAGYAFAWIFLLLAQSRTGAMMGLIFLAIMVSWKKASRAVAVLAGAAIAGLGLSILWPQVALMLKLATRSGEGLDTLSGRTTAFDYLMNWWRQSPIIGNGYGAGTRSALVEFVKITGLGIGAGHDVLSTVLVDLGLVGLVVLAVVFLLTWRQLGLLWMWSRHNPAHRAILAQLTCLAVWTTISCFVGQSLANVAPPFLVLITTAWVLGRRLRAEARAGAPDAARPASELTRSPPDVEAPPTSWPAGAGTPR
jgi:hypothetical protein